MKSIQVIIFNLLQSEYHNMEMVNAKQHIAERVLKQCVLRLLKYKSVQITWFVWDTPE